MELSELRFHQVKVIAMRNILFWKKVFYHNNPLLHILAHEAHQSVKAVADVYVR